MSNNSIYKDIIVRVSWSMRKYYHRAAILLMFAFQPVFPVPSFSLEETPDEAVHAAAAKPEKNNIFGFDIGMIGGYSTGMSVSNFFYKPYGPVSYT
ncbi:MAG: hypothetical protein QUS12_00445, partial [Methanosarcina sp.]|nr:hypothetical protein [Methanosarcina sp.]